MSEQVLYDINSDGFISITAYGITLGKQSKFQIRFDEEVRILDIMSEDVDKWEISKGMAYTFYNRDRLTQTGFSSTRRGQSMEDSICFHDSADGPAVQRYGYRKWPLAST